MQNQVFCPVCKGTGKIERTNLNNSQLKKEAVATLRRKGFGVREIQRLLGYKSPRSVSVILENC